MEMNLSSLKKTARLAGLLYLLMGIAATYGLMYFPSQTMVGGDSVATAKYILSKEFLFRTKIVSHLISAPLFIFLVFVLYRLLKQVNEHQAKLMVAFVIVQTPMTFLLETFDITALMILKGEILKTLEPEKAQDLVMTYLKTRNYGIIALEIFWGLWLIPLGQLIYKSEFIPRLLGVLLIIGGVAYMIESFTILLFPDYKAFISQYAFVFYSPGEGLTILWLLIWGAKLRSSDAPAAEPAPG